MSKERKKWEDTRIGKWLKEKKPEILDAVKDAIPDKGWMGFVKNMIIKDEKLSPEDKEFALKELEFDIAEMNEISERWKADMTSDSWLSKNARPLVLMSVVAFMFVFITLDSFYKISFDVSPEWIDLYKYVLMATVTAYFGVRGVEKSIKIFKKK